jgi:signal transduction histidine kinase
MRPTRRALIGAALGALIAVASAWLGWQTPERTAFITLLVLAIALIGLGLGSGAAAYAYVAAVAALAVITPLAAPDASGAALRAGDAVRLAAFVLGSPFIVLLVRRAERGVDVAVSARDAAEDARREADRERSAVDLVREAADHALHRAERERARLEEVAEAIPEALVVYDDLLRGTYANRAALRLLGRSFVERGIDDWGRAVAPRDEHGAPVPRDEWPQVAAQRESVRTRMTFRIPMSGRDVLVDVEGTPIPGGGCLLLLRDVGKEEAERRRLSRFASFVAHELRNPLAVAKARIELLQRDRQLPEAAAGHGARALESVSAAIAILERLELYSRADSGRLEAVRKPFALLPAVEAAIERLRARGSERPVEVVVPNGLRALGDRDLALQAITNLLINADRYSSLGAPVRVEATDGDQVALRVIDAGPGVSDDVAERLFHDRVVAGRGLGLGLYLVRATMDAVGGSVTLEQRRPGAIFTLRWQRPPRPAARARPAAARSQPPPAPPARDSRPR